MRLISRFGSTYAFGSGSLLGGLLHSLSLAAGRERLRLAARSATGAQAAPLPPTLAPTLHQSGPYEVQTFPWSGLAPCAFASASDM